MLVPALIIGFVVGYKFWCQNNAVRSNPATQQLTHGITAVREDAAFPGYVPIATVQPQKPAAQTLNTEQFREPVAIGVVSGAAGAVGALLIDGLFA